MPAIVNLTSVSGEDDDVAVISHGSDDEYVAVEYWSTHLLAIVAVALLIAVLLVVVIIAVLVIYRKRSSAASGSAAGGGAPGAAAPYETGSGDIVKQPMSAEDEEHRWKAEDNPHKKWHKMSFSEEADDQDQTDAAIQKKRLLRTRSVSE